MLVYILAFTVVEWGMIFSLLASSLVLPVVTLILASREKQAKFLRDEALANSISEAKDQLDTAAKERTKQAEALAGVVTKVDANTLLVEATSQNNTNLAENVQKIETASNSMKDALLEATKIASELKGAEGERHRALVAKAEAMVAQGQTVPESTAPPTKVTVENKNPVDVAMKKPQTRRQKAK